MGIAIVTDRLKRLGFTLLALTMIAAGVANLVHGLATGEIRARHGWITAVEHPFWFHFYEAASAAGALIFAAGLWLGWGDRRAFERNRARLRPPLDDARRRPPGG